MNYDDAALRVARSVYDTLSTEKERMDDFYAPGAKLVVAVSGEAEQCFVENRWSGLMQGKREFYRWNAKSHKDDVISHLSGCVTTPKGEEFQSNEMIVFATKTDPIVISYHSVRLSVMERPAPKEKEAGGEEKHP